MTAQGRPGSLTLGDAATVQSEPHVMRLDDPAMIHGADSRGFWRDRHRHDRILLELRTLTPAENGYWAGRLNASYRACGCPGATAGLVLGLGGYLIFLANTKGFAASGWPEVGLGLLALGVGSAMGKLLGIAWARARFGSSLRELAAVISGHAASPD